MEIHIPGSGGFLDALFHTNEAYEGPSDNVIPNADEGKLIEALAAMERGDSEYVILQDGDRFLQAAGDARAGYALEYNDGSDKFQYRATNPRLPGGDIADAFIAYLNRDPSWQPKFTWEKFSF